MNTRTILGLTASALVMGGTMVGCATGQTRVASAATKAEARSIASAEVAAKKASAALAKRQAAQAVSFAETAVQLRPQDGEYRALLGKAYLASGRFASARQALADALSLDAGLPGVALNLALAETASGDVEAARRTLSANADKIAPADRGLALALAGDAAAGVEVLQTAARAPDADAKVRQNLALAYALAGRWPEARTTAMLDLPPAEADARIVRWASFARPTGAADQIASLLGVTPVADTGQPAMLALVTQPGAGMVAEVAPDDPIDAYMPAAPVDAGVAAVAAIAAAPDAVAETPVAASPAVNIQQVTFGPRQEVVQAVPLAVARAAAAPARATVPAVADGKGGFVVQLGAFRTVAVARDSWRQAQSKYPALAGRSASSGAITAKGATFYRLSVGGFARPEATELCVKVKASGGSCFVRAVAGDKLASWNNGTQVAAR